MSDLPCMYDMHMVTVFCVMLPCIDLISMTNSKCVFLHYVFSSENHVSVPFSSPLLLSELTGICCASPIKICNDISRLKSERKNN